jgi:hypothetical protein
VSVVQALLSLHGAFGVNTHPVAGSHVSVVQALLSLHGAFGICCKVMLWQVSPGTVHCVLSTQTVFEPPVPLAG